MMILRLAFIFVPAFMISVNNVSGYKPVVLLHGVLSAHEEMEVLAGYITSAHPGTVIHNIALYENLSSVDTSMWTQLNGTVEKMKPVLTDPNGVHMICHSQGVTIDDVAFQRSFIPIQLFDIALLIWPFIAPYRPIFSNSLSKVE